MRHCFVSPVVVTVSTFIIICAVIVAAIVSSENNGVCAQTPSPSSTGNTGSSSGSASCTSTFHLTQITTTLDNPPRGAVDIAQLPDIAKHYQIDCLTVTQTFPAVTANRQCASPPAQRLQLCSSPVSGIGAGTWTCVDASQYLTTTFATTMIGSRTGPLLRIKITWSSQLTAVECYPRTFTVALVGLAVPQPGTELGASIAFIVVVALVAAAALSYGAYALWRVSKRFEHREDSKNPFDADGTSSSSPSMGGSRRGGNNNNNGPSEAYRAALQALGAPPNIKSLYDEEMAASTASAIRRGADDDNDEDNDFDTDDAEHRRQYHSDGEDDGVLRDRVVFRGGEGNRSGEGVSALDLVARGQPYIVDDDDDDDDNDNNDNDYDDDDEHSPTLRQRQARSMQMVQSSTNGTNSASNDQNRSSRSQHASSLRQHLEHTVLDNNQVVHSVAPPVPWFERLRLKQQSQQQQSSSSSSASRALPHRKQSIPLSNNHPHPRTANDAFLVQQTQPQNQNQMQRVKPFQHHEEGNDENATHPMTQIRPAITSNTTSVSLQFASPPPIDGHTRI